ncbi:ATP-binding protein [Novispirillum sp. DQ9]|uniref:sensor histidine kinase n=1 Tax=Novispirillum sp. DQ9 TaxID=3398612 RepID=UPI003C7CDE00
MFEMTLEEAFTVAAVVTVLVPPLALGLWWHARRRFMAEDAAATAEARAVALEEALATAPDGWFAWFHPAAEDGAEPRGGPQGAVCSRRLAVLLSLFAGRDSTFDEVLAAFRPADADILRGAAAALRADGEGFEEVLTLHDDRVDADGEGAGHDGVGERFIRVSGQRAVTDDGRPLADLLWMRDVTAEEAALHGLSAAAAAIAAERDRLRAAFDALPVPVWLRDGGLRVVHANRAFHAAAASSGDEGGDDGDELAEGVTAREMRTLASTARAAGTPRSAAFHVVVEGSRRLLEVTEAPAGAPGAERITVGLALDATRIEDLRTTLEREVKSHAKVLERLGTAIAIYGPDTRLRFHNTAFARLWRLDDDWLAEEPTYGAVLEALRSRRLLPEVADYPAFKEAELGRFKTLLDSTEDLLHLPDGKTLRRVLSPHPLGGLMATYEDVTDRLALEASRNTLIAVQRQTLDHLHEAVAVFGSDGRLRLHNPAFASLWGLSEDALAEEPTVGDLVARLPAAFRDAACWHAMRAHLAAPPQDRDVRSQRVERGDGAILEMVGVPLPDGGVLFTTLDMSDAARAERALRERAEGLAAADHMKSAFMANVSYELRTPLTTVLGFSEILADEYYGPLNPRQKEYARGIAETAQALAGLIDDIADLVSIEAGRMTLSRAPVDIHGLLASVLALTREALRRKTLTLNFDCPPDIGTLVADEKRLKQVLYHLLLNAIVFTPEGGQIILAAQPEKGADGGAMIAFTVADTGIGMSEAEQAVAFDRFARGPASTGRGLGLSLVKSFVDLHGGTVELVSVPGEGTTVIVRLPVG